MDGALISPFGEAGRHAQIGTGPEIERNPVSARAISASEPFDLWRSARGDRAIHRAAGLSTTHLIQTITY